MRGRGAAVAPTPTPLHAGKMPSGRCARLLYGVFGVNRVRPGSMAMTTRTTIARVLPLVVPGRSRCAADPHSLSASVAADSAGVLARADMVMPEGGRCGAGWEGE